MFFVENKSTMHACPSAAVVHGAPAVEMDFRGGWSKERYDAAQASLDEFLRRYPLVLPPETLYERRKETAKLRAALEELGLSADVAKLSTIGVRKRRLLALVEQADIESLGLEGTLAQYRSVYELAMEECDLASPDCDQREICMDELFERLDGLKQLRDMMEEENTRPNKKPRLEV
jgi:hypothetical protein